MNAPIGVDHARAPRNRRGVEIVAAPSNLGLPSDHPRDEPGVWRTPEVLLSAGLADHLPGARLQQVPRLPYQRAAQPGTRILNGLAIRQHALALAAAVECSLDRAGFTLVLGGDCSILLGCLLGARRAGRCGLVHLDGHLDFDHPGNYDAGSRLGTAAGMDLALATGRGELLLTHWPRIGSPLVGDEDVVQVGDRDTEAPPPQSARRVVLDPSIHAISVQEIGRLGIPEVASRIIGRLVQRGLERVWLHVDLDILDQTVLPAVDTPGSPGLDFPELTDLVARLVASGRVVGADLTIYDPDRDPAGTFVSPILECLSTWLRTAATEGGA